MAGERFNSADQRTETIGDVLQGAASVQDSLQRMADLLRQTNDELATENALRNDVTTDLVNTLESFVAAVSAATDDFAAFDKTASAPAMTGPSAGQESLLDRVSSLMAGVLEAVDERITQVAQSMDDALTSANGAASRSPSIGGFGQSGPASQGEAAQWGVIRIDELNQAIAQFISTLGRIEAVMEKATDIQVTVEAGDGWD